MSETTEKWTRDGLTAVVTVVDGIARVQEDMMHLLLDQAGFVRGDDVE